MDRKNLGLEAASASPNTNLDDVFAKSQPQTMAVGARDDVTFLTKLKRAITTSLSAPSNFILQTLNPSVSFRF